MLVILGLSSSKGHLFMSMVTTVELLYLHQSVKKTTFIYYTLTEGTTPLVSFQFTKNPMNVWNIIIEPSTTGEKFLILGERDGQGIEIGLDFSKIFTSTCDPDKDYEPFSPRESTDSAGQSCILGHQIIYRKRKPQSACFNNERLERELSRVNCTCTEDDWECDFGYQRPLSGGECGLVSNPPTYPPSYCPAGSTYYKTAGYRKVTSDTCVGGVSHLGEGPFDCPNAATSDSKLWIIGVVIAIIFIVIVILAFAALRSERFRERIPFLSKLAGKPYESMEEQENTFEPEPLDETEEKFIRTIDLKEVKEQEKPIEKQSLLVKLTDEDEPFDPRAIH